MKLQISFDMPDLEIAIATAKQVAHCADILEVGSILIFNYGVQAIEQFKNAFPTKIILADTKIIDRGTEVVTLFAKAGADWITVMAGTNKNVIHATCTAAHSHKIKVLMDLLDANSAEQAALEAKNWGVDALLFHKPHEDGNDTLAFLDKWELVKGNTTLPIFISGRLNRDTIQEISPLKPDGIIIGKGITGSQNPYEEAQFFYDICVRHTL